MNARIWMNSLSTAGRLQVPASEQPEQPRVIVTEFWNGQEWIERRLVWDGAQYSEVK